MNWLINTFMYKDNSSQKYQTNFLVSGAFSTRKKDQSNVKKVTVIKIWITNGKLTVDDFVCLFSYFIQCRCFNLKSIEYEIAIDSHFRSKLVH